VEQSAAAAEGLNELAARLAKVVQVFQLNGEQATTCAPVVWASRSSASVAGLPKPATPPEASSTGGVKPALMVKPLQTGQRAPANGVTRTSVAVTSPKPTAAVASIAALANDDSDWESF
jgi:hypothetical protein